MRRVFLLLLVAIGATSSGIYIQKSRSGEPASPTTAQGVAQRKGTDIPPAARPEDEKAIKALLDTFVKAFNSGDAAGAAATYTDTAVVVDEDGGRLEGRKAIQDQYAASFKDSPKCTIELKVDVLHFLGEQTALEQGSAKITPPAGVGGPETSRFTAIYVKQGGKWYQAAVRDEPAKNVSAHDRLKELEWMVGDWVNESADAMVSATCSWAKGGAFLDREFSIKTEGKPGLSGMQRIGWDPVREQFKTWIFDSLGGHAEGFYTRNGNQWIVKIEGVTQDGKPMSATNIITRLDKDRLGWQSTHMTVGGAAAPGVDEFVVVRKPPEAGK